MHTNNLMLQQRRELQGLQYLNKAGNIAGGKARSSLLPASKILSSSRLSASTGSIQPSSSPKPAAASSSSLKTGRLSASTFSVSSRLATPKSRGSDGLGRANRRTDNETAATPATSAPEIIDISSDGDEFPGHNRANCKFNQKWGAASTQDKIPAQLGCPGCEQELWDAFQPREGLNIFITTSSTAKAMQADMEKIWGGSLRLISCEEWENMSKGEYNDRNAWKHSRHVLIITRYQVPRVLASKDFFSNGVKRKMEPKKDAKSRDPAEVLVWPVRTSKKPTPAKQPGSWADYSPVPVLKQRDGKGNLIESSEDRQTKQLIPVGRIFLDEAHQCDGESSFMVSILRLFDCPVWRMSASLFSRDVTKFGGQMNMFETCNSGKWLLGNATKGSRQEDWKAVCRFSNQLANAEAEHGPESVKANERREELANAMATFFQPFTIRRGMNSVIFNNPIVTLPPHTYRTINVRFDSRAQLDTVSSWRETAMTAAKKAREATLHNWAIANPGRTPPVSDSFALEFYRKAMIITGLPPLADPRFKDLNLDVKDVEAAVSVGLGKTHVLNTNLSFIFNNSPKLKELWNRFFDPSSATALGPEQNKNILKRTARRPGSATQMSKMLICTFAPITSYIIGKVSLSSRRPD